MALLDPAQIGQPLSVGEVAARSGVAVSAVHFYEARGLIHSVRTSGNQRRYTRDVLRRVAVIKVAQRIGISLADIQQALATLPEGRAPTASDWNRLSARWREDLTARIAQLSALRDQLSDCIGCGCLSIEVCRLRNPLDAASEQGPGPQLLEQRAREEAGAAKRALKVAKVAKVAAKSAGKRAGAARKRVP